MYCPACGTEASTDQKFCRSCGMGLQMVFQLVVEYGSAGPHEATLGAEEHTAGSLERVVHQQPEAREWPAAIVQC
jgi:zinc-ribbon domain